MSRQIDFSCKHSVLIANPDGSYSHMDEPFFQAEQIAPDTWKILSSGDYSYLFAGEQEAVSIDTGYGAGNLRAFLQTLTDKPVRNVINTHSHFDHTANNGYFEKAYMAHKAVSLATIPYASFEGIDFIQDYRRVGIGEGFAYDLGGRTLEVFDIPDHTADGIALLDRKERLLITGDEFMPMPMGKQLKRITVETFYGYLEKLMAHRHEFDRLVCGGGVHDASLLDAYYHCAKAILAGDKGEPQQGGKRGGPPTMPPGPNGELVYDRILPHAGDGGAGKPQPAGNYYVKHHGGIKIVYDLDKTEDTLESKREDTMPIGIIVNASSVILGGLTGSFLGRKLSENLKTQMNTVFGLCAMCMGISAVVLMKNMPAVVFSVILGTLIGLALKVGVSIQKASAKILDRLLKNADAEIHDLMLTAVVLFCASGTGIYGALDSGMTGNHSVLIAKSVLDFFTAMIFACQLGKITALISIPQFAVLTAVFALAKVIVPMTTDIMISDFKACGGFVLVATGLRMMKLKPFPVADMIPAMVLVMPISYAWTAWLLPLIS